jgi:uncharacterized membrane-anchored protein
VLLQSVVEATDKGNKERRAENLPEMFVEKWVQQPTFDHASHTAYWSIEARDSRGAEVVNSIAVRLGRSGFEKLVFISAINDYHQLGGTLDHMLKSFSFPEGQTYEDHVSTDKMAGYGIAALVGALVGAKAVKVAAVGGIALFFKPILAVLLAILSKAWVILLA